MSWGDKRFHSLNYHLRRKFGTKVFKVPLDPGFTCPNRDGTKGVGGCAFCSAAGSGDFAGDRALPVKDQFRQVTRLMHSKWPDAKYLAYFQAFSNTYAPPSVLRQLYDSVLEEEGVVGLSIATRPDCLPDQVLDLLKEFNQITYLWVELGLQTIHEATSQAMNLGYGWREFVKAVQELRAGHIAVCPHIILGLPGENREMMMETAYALADLDIQGIKIHLLHVMQGTPLALMYEESRFQLMEQAEYVNLVVDILEVLPAQVIIHRLTGDSPRQSLIGPGWSLKKWEVLNSIDRELESRQTYQGAKWRNGLV
ncbi:MAG: TIGR01212 family radical SAM protein [Syntrophomonadaceae bacterium]|nr:TIGR01212 family radical SAM protein [Syntrophomonadaceae bacterium]